MKNNFKIATLSILFTFIFSSILFCQTNNLLTGAERTTEYLPLLKGKNIGLVVNQTSMIGSIHLVDSLINLGLNVKKIFAPEQGFRGNADAGEKISDSKEPFLNGITNTTNQHLHLVSDEEINESEIDTNHCMARKSNHTQCSHKK